MHSESLTQAILGTALLFNTVFKIPEDMSCFGVLRKSENGNCY